LLCSSLRPPLCVPHLPLSFPICYQVKITDITPIPSVVTVSELYPTARKEGVRVDFLVKAKNAEAADKVIELLTESKLTQGLRQAKVLSLFTVLLWGARCRMGARRVSTQNINRH